MQIVESVTHAASRQSVQEFYEVSESERVLGVRFVPSFGAGWPRVGWIAPVAEVVAGVYVGVGQSTELFSGVGAFVDVSAEGVAGVLVTYYPHSPPGVVEVYVGDPVDESSGGGAVVPYVFSGNFNGQSGETAWRSLDDPDGRVTALTRVSTGLYRVFVEGLTDGAVILVSTSAFVVRYLITPTYIEVLTRNTAAAVADAEFVTIYLVST